MTIKKFREKVVESKYSKQLAEVSVQVTYKHLAEPVKLEGLTNVYRYCKKQVKLFDKVKALPGVTKQSRDHFFNACTKLEQFINRVENLNVGNFERELNDIIHTVGSPKVGSNFIITADCPEFEFFVELQKTFPSSVGSAYQYLINNKVAGTNNPDQIKGLMLAYEFQMQDHTDITQRRNNEKKSLGQIRSGFEKHLNTTEAATEEYLKRTKERFDEHSEEVNQLKITKEGNFDDWFNSTKDSFNTFDSESHNKIEELEKLYTEKLRLDAPVQYWSKRALWMNVASGISLLMLTVIVGLAAYILYNLLTEDLDIYNRTEFLADAGSLKWSIIYITLFSFLAYLVRTLARVSFSFLHLARDAEERKQLTHVYLALSEESEMSKEDREIVLQSIFSRSDTGLLKGDSSPTMPGIILEKLNGK